MSEQGLWDEPVLGEFNLSGLSDAVRDLVVALIIEFNREVGHSAAGSLRATAATWTVDRTLDVTLNWGPGFNVDVSFNKSPRMSRRAKAIRQRILDIIKPVTGTTCDAVLGAATAMKY